MLTKLYKHLCDKTSTIIKEAGDKVSTSSGMLMLGWFDGVSLV